jgi:hypothetical protein
MQDLGEEVADPLLVVNDQNSLPHAVLLGQAGAALGEIMAHGRGIVREQAKSRGAGEILASRLGGSA